MFDKYYHVEALSSKLWCLRLCVSEMLCGEAMLSSHRAVLIAPAMLAG